MNAINLFNRERVAVGRYAWSVAIWTLVTLRVDGDGVNLG